MSLSRVTSLARYGGYLLATVVPVAPLAAPWRLRRLLRFRVFDADPRLIRRRVVGPPDWSPRQQEHYRRDLLDRFRRQWAVGGDWDRVVEEFSARGGVRAAFAERGRVADEAVLAALARAADVGDAASVRRLGLEQDLEAHLLHILSLTASIRASGLRSQRELSGRPTTDEITVCLSRSGEPILLRGGNHRVAIARHLDLEAVPVLVGGAHPHWLTTCAGTYGTSARALRRAVRAALGAPGD